MRQIQIDDHSGEQKGWADCLEDLQCRLQSIEETMLQIQGMLADDRPQKEWYTVAEVAEMLGKAEFTVREWCRLSRVYASKRECGRGTSKEWIIAREEVERITNEGLLPL